MKVIKSGTKPFEKTCLTCQCVFEYEPSDAKIEKDIYNKKMAYYVVCPECFSRYVLACHGIPWDRQY